MNVEPSIWSFVVHASFVVKLVMTLLLIASVASWTIIFQRGSFLKSARLRARNFEEHFWSGANLNDLYKELATDENLEGLESIFYAGFAEFDRLKQQTSVSVAAMMQAAQRSMRVALNRETDKLEQNLSFLATVGSTSPYVGLFGTVWGIMSAFRALGVVQQATISMVAPGISEALIATAMGLFAAIPAVIAYNRFSNDVERLNNHYATFQEEFTSILHRQAHAK